MFLGWRLVEGMTRPMGWAGDIHRLVSRHGISGREVRSESVRMFPVLRVMGGGAIYKPKVG